MGEAPQLDGRVLDDPVWQSIAPASGTIQTRPFAGEPGTERTEVRFAFTEDTLFVAVVCHDREPDGIVISDSRRDAPLNETDSFQVIFDTFRDGRNGFVFGTNPAGIEYDGQVLQGGSGVFGGMGGGGRFRGALSAGFNLNWDGAWNVATQVGEFGWSAEFAIPFRTLRYPPTDTQTWGLNFQRNIARHREVAFWSELDRNHDLDRLTDAGSLRGVEPPPQRNLKLIPYAIGSSREPPSAGSDSESDSDLGVDLKYSVTPSLTLDLTYNTDFAQVEVDEQQVNLDRFNLFFPEKRPFLLENAGLFTVGARSGGSRASARVDLFFSRRIGIGPGGELIPIDYGGRLSGKAGRFNVGLLHMQTASVGGLHGNNYAVARVNRELGERSSVGGMFVSREGVGSLAPENDTNRAYAIDGKWGIGEHHTIETYLARTDTPGLDGDDSSLLLSYNLGKPQWRGNLSVAEARANFNPEVGFMSRREFRNFSAFGMRTIRPKNLLGFHELRPHVSYSGIWDFDDYLETEYIHVDNHWEWRNGFQVHTGVNFTKEGVKETFEIVEGIPVQAGRYSHDELQTVFSTNQAKPFSVYIRNITGGFFGGDRSSTSFTLLARRGERLTSELTWDHNDVDIDAGSFQVNLGRLRLSYSITPRMLVQALAQYNDQSDNVSANLRFSWLQDANTGLFVVYNEVDELGARILYERPDRTVIVKYSRLVDVFR
ncbi:MAG: carbohydrate binding family 9 domain-containing protein [Holophagales bacterium]|nr:carbohydrate binding family 9 domain-containing protein [Holophagales bacterium]MYC09567.1 carbohydrate binding family 9 domain-containing protein [Holophagales bacterium]